MDEGEIEEFLSIKLSDVIVQTTSLNDDDIQRSVFNWNDGDPCPQPAQLNSSSMDECVHLTGYDYFQGSEVSYIYGCIILCAVPLIWVLCAYGVIKVCLKIKVSLYQCTKCDDIAQNRVTRRH